jgi:hypothetical protein
MLIEPKLIQEKSQKIVLFITNLRNVVGIGAEIGMIYRTISILKKE